MDIAEKIKLLEDGKHQLDIVTKELKKRAYRKAETEREYRKALAIEEERLRTEKMPVTLIHDISRGRLSELRYQRDIASMEYDICKEYMRNIRINQESMRTLVSFDKEHLKGV